MIRKGGTASSLPFFPFHTPAWELEPIEAKYESGLLFWDSEGRQGSVPAWTGSFGKQPLRWALADWVQALAKSFPAMAVACGDVPGKVLGPAARMLQSTQDGLCQRTDITLAALELSLGPSISTSLSPPCAAAPDALLAKRRTSP